MATMKSSAAPRSRQRFYLFAGMGGRAARRRHRSFLLLALLLAGGVSEGLVLVFYLMNSL